MRVYRFARGVTAAVFLGCLALTPAGGALEDRVDLSGPWRFQLDPNDLGMIDRWERQTLDQHITLPGVLQAQGFGDEVTIDTK